jgi:hypothetical protein
MFFFFRICIPLACNYGKEVVTYMQCFKTSGLGNAVSLGWSVSPCGAVPARLGPKAPALARPQRAPALNMVSVTRGLRVSREQLFHWVLLTT